MTSWRRKPGSAPTSRHQRGAPVRHAVAIAPSSDRRTSAPGPSSGGAGAKSRRQTSARRRTSPASVTVHASPASQPRKRATVASTPRSAVLKSGASTTSWRAVSKTSATSVTEGGSSPSRVCRPACFGRFRIGRSVPVRARYRRQNGARPPAFGRTGAQSSPYRVWREVERLADPEERERPGAVVVVEPAAGLAHDRVVTVRPAGSLERPREVLEDAPHEPMGQKRGPRAGDRGTQLSRKDELLREV